MSTALAHESTARMLARGYRSIARAHPERRVLMDRQFLTDVRAVLFEVAQHGATPSTQGSCSALQDILGELLAWRDE